MTRHIAFAAALLLACSPLFALATDPNTAKKAVEEVTPGNVSAKKEGSALDKAISNYTEIIRLHPKRAEAFVGRGGLCSEKNDSDKAIKDFSEAILLYPKREWTYWAYAGRAGAWSMKGELNNAVNDLSEAIRLKPRDATAYRERAEAWSKKGDLNKAIEDDNEAIRLNPKNAISYCHRGETWSKGGDPDKAIEDFAEGIKLNPKYILAYNNLAWVQATCSDERHRDGKKAVANAQKACELAGWQSGDCLETLAAAYAESGDFANAIKWEEKAIEITAAEAGKQEMRSHLALFKDGKPYRDMPKK